MCNDKLINVLYLISFVVIENGFSFVFKMNYSGKYKFLKKNYIGVGNYFMYLISCYILFMFYI